MSVQVPYENTLGGFAMFSSGVTDLAPELLGWYGSPAINLDVPTTVFLIGNHFSVHQTRVLIGGQEITTPEMLSRQVMKVTIPSNAIALVERTGRVAGGWQMPTFPDEISTTPETAERTNKSAATASISAPSSVYVNLTHKTRYTFADTNAITLTDAAIPGTLDALKLSVTQGTLTLGRTDGITFTDGANGSASLTIAGTVDKLNGAINGLVYTPDLSTNGGSDALKISFVGAGASATCEVSVAITVKPKASDYLYVDVQLATPYGATSHLLVPAWHLGKTGAGSLATSDTAGGSSGGGGSPLVSKPQWITSQFALGYVAKGIGIAASDPPTYTPNALTLNLGANYQVPADNIVTLKLSLGGNASGSLQPLKITVVPSTTTTSATPNYDPKSHLLTITGTDFDNLATYLFNVIRFEFGTANPIIPPNTSFDISATISGTGQKDFDLINKLTVNLVAASGGSKGSTTSSGSPSNAASP